MIGVTFEGMDKFTLQDLTEIKKETRKTELTMNRFCSIISMVMAVYGTGSQVSFNATQYCSINKDE